MHIVCPECTTGFDIDDSAFANGNARNVICAKCEHQWLVEAPISAKDIPIGEDTEMIGNLLSMKDGNTPDRLRPTGSHNLMDDDVASMIDNADADPNAPNDKKKKKKKFNTVKPKVPKSHNAIKLQQAVEHLYNSNLTASEQRLLEEQAITEFMPPIAAKIFNKISKNPLLLYSRISNFQSFFSSVGERTLIYRFYKGYDYMSDHISTLTIAWMLLLSSIMIFLAIFFGWRDTAVSQFPKLDPIYAYLGMGHDVLGRGITLSLPSVRLNDQGDIEKLEINGQLTNQNPNEINVPLLLGTLENDQQRAVFSWVFRAKKNKLKTGEVTNYETSLTNFPSDSHKLIISFTTPEEASALIALQ